MRQHLNLAVVFGGTSEEHPVSVKSAREVAKSLDRDKYVPHFVAITRDGTWRLCDHPDDDWEHGAGRPVTLPPDKGVHGLVVLDGERSTTIRLDAVFPVLHGRHGEDGAVQGLLELSGIPYVGCDIQSSALCMDKSLAYLVARSAGVPTPTVRTASATVAPETELLDALTYPVFVKPARSGSSFGVTKVESSAELTAAIEMAGKFDDKVLIEDAVAGTEVGCAILGNSVGNSDELFAGEVDQIRVSHGLFQIHQEADPESGSENSTIVVPADIPSETRARVQETAKTVYRALGCRGLARVDLFLADDGTLVLNEVNTLPGLTSYSRYPRMMAAAGLSLGDVIDRVVALALEPGR